MNGVFQLASISMINQVLAGCRVGSTAARTLLYILADPLLLYQVFPLLQEGYTEILVPFLGGHKVQSLIIIFLPFKGSCFEVT